MVAGQFTASSFCRQVRQPLQLDRVLAPKLEAQAAERNALAAQQQVRVLWRKVQGLACCQAKPAGCICA